MWRDEALMPGPVKQERPRHASYFLYMVQGADGTYYSGSTSHLEARLARHNAGRGAKYLRGRGPARVVYVKAYRYYKCAVQAECALKRLTRAQKAALASQYARNHESDQN